MKENIKRDFTSTLIDKPTLKQAKVVAAIKDVLLVDYITEAVRKENAKMKQKA